MSHLLMYNEIPVMQFDIPTHTTIVYHRSMLPYAMDPDSCGYSDMVKFCADRVLMNSRNYCKEILDACQIDDQDDMSVCLISHGLSFRDNYWIKEENEQLNWKNINLYQNEFSKDIAVTALTGEIRNVHIGDKLFTGELTGKGTRSKCYIRQDGQLYLAKQETPQEIASEVLSGYICKWLNIPGTEYVNTKIFGQDCSVCQIKTSPSVEMIPARDILSRTDNIMSVDSKYYDVFLNIDPYQFAKMQVFDYITLNSDRNRDNFALKRENGRIVGLYPIFDHDSCFKAQTIDGHYFVTGTQFNKVPQILIDKYSQEIIISIQADIQNFHTNLHASKNKDLCIKLKGQEIYEDMMERSEKLLTDLSHAHIISQQAELINWFKKKKAWYTSSAGKMNSFSDELAKQYKEAAIYADQAIKQLQQGQPISAPPLFNTVTSQLYNEYQSGSWKEINVAHDELFR